MSGLRRVLLTVEYRGTRYAGWQRQSNGPGVQEELERAVTKASGVPTAVVGASRTDAGVHALGQRAHFDTAANIPDDKWPFVLNTMLPGDIKAVKSQRVGETLHARFSARGKEYEYRIFNRRFPSPLRSDFTAFVPLPLDFAGMENALNRIVGRHDFAAFAAAGHSAKTTVRTMREARLTRDGDEIVIHVAGDAFLYNMVRIIAGTLIAVGLGKLGENAFDEAFNTGSRLSLGPTAPPQGLTLLRVWYEGGL